MDEPAGSVHPREVLVGEGPAISGVRVDETSGNLLNELIVDDGDGLPERLLDVVIEQPAQFRALEGHKRSSHGRSLAPVPRCRDAGVALVGLMTPDSP